ncbi:hypothetical protein HJFPF1_13157 [Paramyrothecium foliicola]|nr:hypothetical protein HJFPF1_13157 [Paramyrothecium foliicola]
MCRERKRKCDNLRPTCSACSRVGARCDYGQQDASSFDAASLAILDRLALLEGLVRNLPSTLIPSSAQLPQNFSSTTAAFAARSPPGSAPFPASPVSTFDLGATCSISTDRVLQWPVFQELLSPLRRFRFVDVNGFETYTYLGDLVSQSTALAATRPSHLESINEPSATVNISTDRADIDNLVNRYFKRVNIKNPILSRLVVSRYCRDYCEHGALFNLETCLVLLICALGAISTEFDPQDKGSSDLHGSSGSHARQPDASRMANLKLGHCYFVAAEKRLGMALSATSNLAVQCLCLAGIYQMYAVRPMRALGMFHAAGSLLQSLLSTGSDLVEEDPQVDSSLFWTCFKSEREILAEIPVSSPTLREPASPTSYPPPHGPASSSSDEWVAAEEDSWYFLLSEMTLRRIANQIAEVVCNYIDNGQPRNVEELIPDIAAFEQKLERYRELLAPAVNFPDVPQPASTEWQQYSRGRYYRVLELMHRPFLFAILHAPDPGAYDPSIRRLAEKALCNAHRYLLHSVTSHRHHGTWLQIRNELREASLLLAASRSPANLAMPDRWEEGVAKTLATFEYWSWEYPPCQTYTDVIVTLSGPSALRDADENTPISSS